VTVVTVVAVVAVVAAVVVVVKVVLVLLPARLYISNLFGPPHISRAFPLQGMLQPTLPSGAGPPP
jgi:hypothetical protein